MREFPQPSDLHTEVHSMKARVNSSPAAPLHTPILHGTTPVPLPLRPAWSLLVSSLSEVLQKAVKEDVNFKREGDWAEKYTLAIKGVKSKISNIRSHIQGAEHYIDDSESSQASYIKNLMDYLDAYGTSFQTFLNASIMHKPDTRAGFDNYKLNKVLKNVILQLDSICHQDTS